MNGLMYLFTTVSTLMFLTNVFTLRKLPYLRLKRSYNKLAFPVTDINTEEALVELKNSIYMLVLSVSALCYVFLLVSHNSGVTLLVGSIPFITLFVGFVPFAMSVFCMRTSKRKPTLRVFLWFLYAIGILLLYIEEFIVKFEVVLTPVI